MNSWWDSARQFSSSSSHNNFGGEWYTPPSSVQFLTQPANFVPHEARLLQEHPKNIFYVFIHIYLIHSYLLFISFIFTWYLHPFCYLFHSYFSFILVIYFSFIHIYLTFTFILFIFSIKISIIFFDIFLLHGDRVHHQVRILLLLVSHIRILVAEVTVS